MLGRTSERLVVRGPRPRLEMVEGRRLRRPQCPGGNAVKILEKKKRLDWYYDEEADVVYLNLGKPRKAAGVDLGQGVVVRYGMLSGHLAVVDQDGFFAGVLDRLRARLAELGAVTPDQIARDYLRRARARRLALAFRGARGPALSTRPASKYASLSVAVKWPCVRRPGTRA